MEKEYLIIGGTGSLGTQLVFTLGKRKDVKGIRIFSRDEYKHWSMKMKLLKKEILCPVSHLVGDVRSFERLELAARGVDIIINCAAMKQVPACEENPFEGVETNIIGAQNIIRAAILNKVKKVMHISTDKAVYPINLYGMTKGVAEKLFIHSNVYSPNQTRFACCRYGNVIGSRGSIVPLLRDIYKKKGVVKLTHEDMTRFWITLQDVADFILERLEEMKSGSIYVPMMPSMRLITMAKAIAPGCKIEYTGIRDGEKIHECLITKEESRDVIVHDNHFEIIKTKKHKNTRTMCYTSENNNKWLSENDLKNKIKQSIIYDI